MDDTKTPAAAAAERIVTCYIYLTREDLVSRGACPEGLALFDSIAALRGRRRKIRLEWSALSFVWLESGGRRFASWLYRKGLAPMPPLRDADLMGADLSDADLMGADLSGADLSGAYLRGADLSGADLSGADLSGADLSGAYLRGADLRGADLSGAYLRGADLRGAYRPHDPPAGWVVGYCGRLKRGGV